MEDTIERYHGCYYRNRNGTRKLIDIARGDNCVCATVNPFWRPVKLKYLRGRHYDKRSSRKNFKKEIIPKVLSESGLTVQDKAGIFHPVFVKDRSTLFSEPQ